MAHRRQQFGK